MFFSSFIYFFFLIFFFFCFLKIFSLLPSLRLLLFFLCSPSPVRSPLSSQGCPLPSEPFARRKCQEAADSEIASWSRRCAPLLCALPGGGWREPESGPGLNGEKGCLASMGSASLLKGGWIGEVASPFPTHNAKWIYLVDSRWMAVM